MSEDRNFKILTDREHVLIRPNTYIGSVVSSPREEWILDEDGKVKRSTLDYPEGLLKIINEILDNSLDEYKRTDGSYSNKISVKISADKIIIEDNGRGLPVKKAEDGSWIPVSAFTKLRAGTNFSDEDRNTIGTNGIGSSATNIFSKFFEVDTCDGENRMRLTCRNNMESERHQLFKALDTPMGTKVTFIPDYERFGVSSLPNDICIAIKTRLRLISWFFPKCDLRYNGEKLAVKARSIADMFSEDSVSANTDDIYALIYPTEDTNEVLTYVNGLYLKREGTHVDYITNLIVRDVREKLAKKYKNIKPGDIRNRLGVVLFFKNFPNCQFDSQTKERLTNSADDISAYLKDSGIVDKITKKILYSKPLLDNITDIYKAKEEIADRKLAKSLNKSKRKIASDKYFPPTGKSGKKYLMLTEGYSAFSGISPVLGRDGIGYYACKGKALNVQDLTPGKFMTNQEISDIINILGIDIADPNTDMEYEKVVFLHDADFDGTAIGALLLTLFNKVCPRMFEEGRICVLNTPLLIGKKGNKVEKYFFEFPKQSEMNNKLTWKYLKGLGSWNATELNQVIEREGGLDKLMISYKKDDEGDASIENWMGGKNAVFRKSKLRGKEFHIDKL